MKTMAVAALLCAGLVSALLLTPANAGPAPWANCQVKPLTGQIDYDYVGNLGQTDDEGRTLVWAGTITGDITGTMYWWFYASPSPFAAFAGGSVAYYAARWEIWDEDRLLLAGESAGKTVFPADPAAAGIWDGHGVVTYGRGHLHALKGRKIYETGPVIKPAPLYGTGIFEIY